QVADRVHAERAPQRVTAKEGTAHDETDPTFSPDGRRLAFLSDAEKKGQPQLYVADLGGGAVIQLTHVTGYLSKPRFSPDGKTGAAWFTEGPADAMGPLAPGTRRTGVVEESIVEQRIVLVPADGKGPLRPVSPAPLFVYEYDWRSDGQAFAAVAAPGSGADNWGGAHLPLVAVPARA